MSRPYLAFIGVPVATLWREPASPRPLDAPALGRCPDMRAWLAAMDVPARRGLEGRVDTQALLGQPIWVLEEQGHWARVAVPDQGDPGQPWGYTGWVPLWHLADAPHLTSRWKLSAPPPPWAPAVSAPLRTRPAPRRAPSRTAGAGTVQGAEGDGPWVTVASPTAWLFRRPDPARPLLEISFATCLPLADDRGPWLGVVLPRWPVGGGKAADGACPVAWLRRDDAAVGWPAGPPPTGRQMVATARRFLGVPYLWGGTSGFAVDCSGLVYLIHRAHGLAVPRDAEPQRDAGGGLPVERDRLAPGDLVFFASQRGWGSVHHVGIYAGCGSMIHAPNAQRPVELIALNRPPYGETMAGACRYLCGSEVEHPPAPGPVRGPA